MNQDTNTALAAVADGPLTVTYQDEEDPAVREGWSIADLGTLQWALERMGALKAEIAENDALKLQWIARIEGRVAALNRRAQSGVSFFEAAARQYMAIHREELLRGGKKKSRSLPSGTVGWRRSGGKLKVVDAEAYLAWAREQPVEAELVRIKVEPAMKPLQELFKRTGEVPPGCDVEPEEDVPYVEPVLPVTALTTRVPSVEA